MFKKSKNTLLILALAMVSVISFVGCSGTKAPTTTTTDSNKPVTLRFAAPEGAFKDEIASFATGFKKDNPNVTIKYEPLAGDWSQKLLVEASSNTLPDVFWCPDATVGTFATKNILVDLNPYFAKYNVPKDDIFPAMLATGNIDGKQYMLPRDYNHVVTYFNIDMFKAAGVALPKDGWTWDDFVNTAKKLVKKDASGKIIQYGCVGNIDWQATAIPMIIGLGGSITSPYPLGTKADFNTPGTIQALTTLKGLVDDGVFVNNYIKGFADFSSKKVAMTFHVRPTLPGYIKDLGGAEHIGCVTFPVMPAKHVVGSGASGYCIAKTTKNLNEAAKLLFYIVSPDGQKVFEATGGSVPVRKSLINDTTWTSYPSSTFNNKPFTDHPEFDILPIDCTLKDRAIGSQVDDAWGKALEALYIGQKSPADAAKYGQDLMQKVFDGQ